MTGASGFVGLALTRVLEAKGHTVIRVLRHSGKADAERARPDSQVAILANLDARTDWRRIVRGHDVVIHLAARAHQRAARQSLADLRPVNVDATAQLARQAEVEGVQRFVYLSSIGVLGQSSALPLAETDSPAPVEPYAQSKHEAEMALRELTAGTNMALTVIRPPLVYGPAAPGTFGRLLAWAQTGQPLPLGAIMANQRSLVGRDNLVDFIQRAVEHPGAADQTFHVADDGVVSTTELLSILAKAAGRHPRLLRVPSGLLRTGAGLVGRGDVAERLLGSLTVETRKAHERLDWRPLVSLEQGLRDAVSNHLIDDPRWHGHA